MGTQGQRLGVLGTEGLHNLGPKQTAGAHLGNLHEVVHADSPEERQAGCEGIYIDAGVDTRAQIVHTVGQRVGQLDVGSGTSLLHVIARDRDAVELRHLLRRIFEDVGDDLHRECRRIDVGVAHHELLQNVVLNGSGHLLELSALLQTCHDVEGEDGQHGTVHGHRHRHLIQGDTAEQHLHVLFVADAHTGLTHIAHHAGVVGVVTTVRRQVESYRKALLTRSEVTAIERIRLLGSRESGILTDGPRAEGVHH